MDIKDNEIINIEKRVADAFKVLAGEEYIETGDVTLPYGELITKEGLLYLRVTGGEPILVGYLDKGEAYFPREDILKQLFDKYPEE